VKDLRIWGVNKYLFSDLEEDGEGEEGHLDDAIVLDAGTEDVMLSDYPADCCPDKCYKRFPFLAGDDDSPFWQGWANLRQKTYQLIENKYFETAVITMILLSSLALVSII
jgi:Sodium ion transport-associated.